MMKEFLLQTYSIALPIILTALMGHIVWLLKEQKKERSEQKKERDALEKGLMILLRIKLIEYHDKYMALGSIPSYAYQNYCDMWSIYHYIFNGNGVGDKMWEEIKALHLATKERKKYYD